MSVRVPFSSCGVVSIARNVRKIRARGAIKLCALQKKLIMPSLMRNFGVVRTHCAVETLKTKQVSSCFSPKHAIKPNALHQEHSHNVSVLLHKNYVHVTFAFSGRENMFQQHVPMRGGGGGYDDGIHVVADLLLLLLLCFCYYYVG